MNGYAIVKLEASNTSVADSILQHFNEYMQQKSRVPSFVSGGEGYFRIECNEKAGASSAAIEAFGTFLVSSGYQIRGISSAQTAEGAQATEVKFARQGGTTKSVVLSTLNVY